MRPYDLQCEYESNPLGIDVPNPALSWKLHSSERGSCQTAYRIIASLSSSGSNIDEQVVWDTSKVGSSQTTGIRYAGERLESGQEVSWKLWVWDRNDVYNESAEAGRWTMGIIHPEDWQGKWIGAADPERVKDSLLLRQEIKVKSGLVRALAYICGLGHYELSINGSKVGDDVLSPGWTNYIKTSLYDSRDITSQLKAGTNAVGIILGNGMYNSHGGRYTKFVSTFGPQMAICQIRLEYRDGSIEIAGTSREWRCSAGPITFSCPFGGEDYDACLYQPGWDLPGFDAGRWQTVVELPGLGGQLRGHSCAAPMLGLFEEFEGVIIHQIASTISVYDLGQNASFMPRLTVHGPRGSSLTLTPAELLNADGRVDRQSVGGGEAYWKYSLNGKGQEIYFPKFFYQGCRYLQVELFPNADGGLPVIDSIVGVVVGSTSKSIGEFECSSDLFNKIKTLIRWAQRSNTVSTLTDCPHREKLGWLEQSYLNGPALRYEHDLNRVFAKIANDMADTQLENGLVPDIAPEYIEFEGGFRDSPEWGSAIAMMPWQHYEFTGDASLLTCYYANMKRYVDYLTSTATDHIVDHGLGDWFDIGPKPPFFAQLTPRSLTATALYYMDCVIVSRTAQMLGETTEQERYTKLADEIKEAFNAKFWNDETQQYSTGSQCANALPLVFGLEPEYQRQGLVDAIVADIEDRGNSFTAGDIGYRYLLRALADGGRSDVIYAMNNQSDKPGYGMQLAKGATALTEAWDASPNCSHNHFMLGQLMEWFYSDLAGIQCDPDGPGFSKILIKPNPVGDISYVNATYDSVRGPIVSNWTCTDDRFRLTVSIPANTTATIIVPTTDPESVTENGLQILSAKGMNSHSVMGGKLAVSVGSGLYTLESAY